MLWILLYAIHAASLVALSIRDANRPVRALAWLAICLCIPFIGIAVYAQLAKPMPVRRQRHAPVRTEPDGAFGQSLSDTQKSLSEVIRNMCHINAEDSRVQVLTDGQQTYEALFQLLQNARHCIDMEYYIFRDDPVGRRVMDLLIDRARSGVQVRFVRDGMGSLTFHRRAATALKRAGVDCRTFFPVRFPWITPEINHRDHCKIVIVDGERALTGGINVGLEYTGKKPGVGPWRDTHLRIEGKAVAQLQVVFNMNWGIATPDRPAAVPQTRGRQRPPALRAAFSGEWAEELTQPVPVRLEPAAVQIIEGGPDNPIETVRNTFFSCLTRAKHSVEITTPYFVPDTDIMTAMGDAIRRNVRVRLIVPLRPDHKLVGYASRTYHEQLLANGVEVFLYKGAVLHAKVLTVDNEVAVVGAANCDLRSFRLNFEVCAVMYSRAIAQQLQQQFAKDLQQCVPLTKEWLSQRSTGERVREHTARLIAPLL